MSQHGCFRGQASPSIVIVCDANDTAVAWTGAMNKPSAISMPISTRKVRNGPDNVMATG